MNQRPAITVVRGDDETLLREALNATVQSLLGEEDRGLAVTELYEDDYGDDDHRSVGPIVDAASTPPLLTECRVIVAHHMGRFSKAADVALLVEYLADPTPSASIVLVWERGVSPRQERLSAVPKSLLKAIDDADGTIVDSSTGSGRKAGAWLDGRLAAAEVSFSPAAGREIANTFGEQRSRVVGLIEVLEVAFERGETLDVDDVAPFLGDAGDVPPWDLTDAIASADVPAAIDALGRMIGPGGRHPLQILASLHNHYGRLLRLDGAGAHNEKEAAAFLGIKGSTFPAKKALSQARSMGHERVVRAIELLARADRDLRGATAWPNELILEVLIARLAQLAR
jgi:DNA polymerase-3 subunit delta